MGKQSCKMTLKDLLAMLNAIEGQENQEGKRPTNGRPNLTKKRQVVLNEDLFWLVVHSNGIHPRNDN